jgi:hypothetical protein
MQKSISKTNSAKVSLLKVNYFIQGLISKKLIQKNDRNFNIIFNYNSYNNYSN